MGWTEHSKWMDGHSYGKTDEEIERTILENDSIDLCNVGWLKNAAANETVFNKGKVLSDIYGSWEGEKALMIGAGQTSHKHIKQIAKKQAKGWKIVATDRAFGRLRAEGIRPDITVTCDAQALTLGFLDGVDSDDTVAVSIFQNPSMLRALEHRGVNTYYFCLINPFSRLSMDCYGRFNKELFCLRAGYVVGFPATDLCQFMGCKTVALIGNELCWFNQKDIEEKYYGGSSFKLFYDNLTKKKYYTIDAFLKAICTFQLFPDMCPDVEWIDCSGGLVQNFKKRNIWDI